MKRAAAKRRPAKPPAKRRPSTIIKIKRAYEPAEKDDGIRILIDRLWPRGLSKASFKFDEWPKELTPSNELRKWYGHDPKRAVEFRRRYLQELAPHRDAIDALKAELKGHTSTLLTATREIELSHAVVLRDVLEK